MITSVFRSLAILSTILCLAAPVGSTNKSGQISSANGKAQIIAVDELTAEFHEENKCITVSALIKNISRSKLRGYATIYFLSAEGQEIYSYEDEVNEGKAFANGATVAFESTARVADVKKIASISVDFTQK